MPAPQRTLLVGVGSHHGDDAVGWRVAEMISNATLPDLLVRCAATPATLLDWIEPCDHLVVCDACESMDAVGTVYNRTWPSRDIDRRHGAGSHDFGLAETLELAERLGRLPARVNVYAIAGCRFQPGETLSPELESALPAIVEQILKDLTDARTIAGDRPG